MVARGLRPPAWRRLNIAGAVAAFVAFLLLCDGLYEDALKYDIFAAFGWLFGLGFILFLARRWSEEDPAG
jgi:hypothetical protein